MKCVLLLTNVVQIGTKAVDGFIRDGRIGHSHLNVPGHDGKFGFGGSRFP